MRCLFVGAGSVAEKYAAGVADSSLSIAGVCDLDRERAERLADRHDAVAVTDLEDALAVEAPLVVNLTSHAAHASVTRQCLAADRHVYTEKPLALEADDAAELLEVADRGDRGLACAPLTPTGSPQRRVGGLLAEGRPGPVRLGYAHAHVGRVTEWHDHPGSFLEVGPLYDGGVYPLTALVAWFGPVERVRVADALDLWPDREDATPSAPTHVEATLPFAAGPVVRLTASLYAPHRSREFYGLELHGDDGSVYLRDSGARSASRGDVAYGRSGREYTDVPPQSPVPERSYTDDLAAFADALAAGRRPRASARRDAHVVAVCNAIERATQAGGPVRVSDYGARARRPAPPLARPSSAWPETRDGDAPASALRLPSIGFGCSRYRDGEYVERVDSIATALDAGYRLLDSAELYGNEHRIGELLAAPGARHGTQSSCSGRSGTRTTATSERPARPASPSSASTPSTVIRFTGRRPGPTRGRCVGSRRSRSPSRRH